MTPIAKTLRSLEKEKPSEEVLKEFRKRIKEIIHGPGSLGGYRTV